MGRYLLGDDILVAPFSSPGDTNGVATREVWIPPGSYQDAWTGATIIGPKLVVSTQPLERIPLWHRKGGLLITAPSAQTVDEQDWSELTMELFPHAFGESDACRYRGELLHAGRAVKASDCRQGYSQIRRVIREGEPGEGTTVFFQESIDGRLSIEILPSERTPPRAWLVRINLAPDHSVVHASVVIDSDTVSSDAVTVLAPLALDRSAEFFPLRGRGAAPASNSGNVVELQLASVVGKRSVSLQLVGRNA